MCVPDFRFLLFFVWSGGMRHTHIRGNGYHLRHVDYKNIFVEYLVWLRSLDVKNSTPAPTYLKNVQKTLKIYSKFICLYFVTSIQWKMSTEIFKLKVNFTNVVLTSFWLHIAVFSTNACELLTRFHEISDKTLFPGYSCYCGWDYLHNWAVVLLPSLF